MAASRTVGEAAIVEPGPPTDAGGRPARILGTEVRRSRPFTEQMAQALT